jgi:hypothetical protein
MAGRPRQHTPARAARLAHPCETCGAAPGALCKTPSGHGTNTEHAARYAAAEAAKAAAESEA